LAHFFGIGGFFVDFVCAIISSGCVIHLRTSSAESFAPTPSSGFCLLPFPAIA
jgi:hypothetical protein